MKQNRMSVSRGATIFSEGERGDTMYVIVEGRVQIQREGSKAPVVLATLRPGSFFGEKEKIAMLFDQGAESRSS